MSKSIKFIGRIVFAGAFLISGIAAVSAQTVPGFNDRGPQSGLGAISSTSQLDVTAVLQNAIQIDIDTAPGGAAVTGGTGTASNGQFAVSLGTLNGLAVGQTANGVTATTQTGGTLYSTPVRLTPRFSGLLQDSATVTVGVDALNSNTAGLAAIREGASAASVLPLLPAPVPAGPVTTSAKNGVSFNRTVGFFIPSGAQSVTGGNLNARVVYLIVPIGVTLPVIGQ